MNYNKHQSSFTSEHDLLARKQRLQPVVDFSLIRYRVGDVSKTLIPKNVLNL